MKYVNSSLLFCMFTLNCMAIGVNFDEAKTIKADKIEYNLKEEEIKTSGNTEMTNASGQRVKVDEITLSKNQTSVQAKDIELWLGSHVYLRAEKITRDGVETIANHADFTACEGCDPYGNAWEISSNKVIHNSDEKMLYFHSATFWIYNENIPLLWLPYYEMPDPSVKYKSGLLSPSLNSTNGMGTQINVPIYINLSNRHDLTATFSYLTAENPLFRLEHRLNLSHSEFRTNASFTHNKMGENRWSIFNNDKIELGQNARAFVYIARTSDKTYLQKYGFYNYQPYLDSGVRLELFGQTSYVVADTHNFQELREPGKNQKKTSGNILPNIRGVYQTDPFFRETYLKFSGDILAVSGTRSSSQRIIGESRIISPWTLWGGNRLTASIAARYDVYNFNETPIYINNTIDKSFSGTKTRFLPNGYVEWGLPLYSTEKDWTYILQPRARLTIMKHTDNPLFALDNDSDGHFLSDTTLFSDNRYSGYDLWENGNFADYGVQWNAFNKNHNIEIFAGQTYDFTKSEEDFNENGFRNGFSDYVGRISYKMRMFNISSRFRLDKENMALNHIENTAGLSYNRLYLSVGHIWDTQPIDIYSTNDENTHEVIGGVGLKLSKRIKVSESVIYNLYEHEIQRHAGGIYYEHPCYHFSLEYKRDNASRMYYKGNTTFQLKFGMSVDGKHY